MTSAIDSSRAAERLIRNVLLDANIAQPADAAGAVYHFVDADARSIYVGSTVDLAKRLSKHVRKSTWVQFAAAGSVIWYPTLLKARLAESALINERQSLFNIRDNDPGARQRLVAYLVEHGRLDLLAPAIRLG